jgi:leucyl aminopeptidase (aminopeptidase T)
MKRRTLFLKLMPALALGLLAAVATPGQTTGQPQDYAVLARRIVAESANIKPGDVVVINGGQHNIPLMEALAIEVQKAGGMPTMFLNTDRVQRSYNVDVPEEYLSQEPRFYRDLFKNIDVWISLPTVEDPKAVYGGVPESRFAKASKAGQVVNDTLLHASKVRGVFISFPTRQQAANAHIDYDTLARMHWAAVGADYRQISEQGSRLKQVLRGAKAVRVTTPAGTDFTFSVGDRPVYVDDGLLTPEKMQSKLLLDRTASLPGGQVFLAPVETSANGRVVVPKNTCNFAPLNDASFEFKNGKIEGFKAAQGADCFAQALAPYSGPKDVFGGISIGLNPALKVMEEGEGQYWPDHAAGLVWISTGDNQLIGGNNKEPGGFGFPLTNATVTVDGKVVVKDGKLVL